MTIKLLMTLASAGLLFAGTETVQFAPGGTIRIEKSFGYLSVEGWDSPAVEITAAQSATRVEQHAGAHELVITAAPHHRRRLLVLPAKKGATPDYQIRVPRDSRLFIQHDYGYVAVSDVQGDIQVRSHTGDMIVALPDPGTYSIDARTRLGRVSSDFPSERLGHLAQFLLGAHYSDPAEAPSRLIFLRMGRGSITIKRGPPSGPFWKD